MGKTIDVEKFYRAFKGIMLNILVNNYALERVAFGFEKVGEAAPIDLYLEHLKLDIDSAPNGRRDVQGIYIDGQERISAEQDYSEYVRDLFVMQMEDIFSDAPKDIRLERDGEDIPLLSRFRDYLFGLLPLFTQVLNEDVEYNFFDIIPTDKEERKTEYPKWKKFVTDILLKPLKGGSRINRYVEDFKNAPYYVYRLIEKKGKNYYLKTSDVNSCEYIFALFSLMKFLYDENGILFELKMLEWEQRKKK